MAFKLGGVRLRSAQHGFPDEEHARALAKFWAALPERMRGGNGPDKNLYDSVAAAAKAVGREPFHGWRMLANLQALGAMAKTGRNDWTKGRWPKGAKFEPVERPGRPRCPACGQPLPRSGAGRKA